MNTIEPAPQRPPGTEGDTGLSSRTIIVSGGGSQLDDGVGNGRAAAVLLARQGANVVVVDRKLSAAEATVSAITAEGGTAAAHEADVTDEAACQEMVAAALGHFGAVGGLVNNVGIGSRGSVVESSLSDWERVMTINVTSMMLASKYAIPAMVDGGSIVNISSISALRPRNLTAYSTSKGAVIALTKAMAVDHAAQGVRVNCVAPGPVYTPMVYAAGMSEEARRQRARASMLGTEGTGWDIGNAVTFLLSDQARWITGQTLVVDGGVTLRGPNRDPGNGS